MRPERADRGISVRRSDRESMPRMRQIGCCSGQTPPPIAATPYYGCCARGVGSDDALPDRVRGCDARVTVPMAPPTRPYPKLARMTKRKVLMHLQGPHLRCSLLLYLRLKVTERRGDSRMGARARLDSQELAPAEMLLQFK